MSQARKILMAGGTFSAALAIGFVMQNGDALAGWFGGVNATPAPENLAALAAVEGPVLAAPEVILAANVALPRQDGDSLTPVAPTLAAVTNIDGGLDGNLAPVAATDCVPLMTAAAMPSAMVRLDIAAACSPSSRFKMHHQGMVFTAATNAQGLANIVIPALSENAVFIADFDNELSAVANVTVPDFTRFDRAVLQWQDNAAVSIQAFEFGADYGDAGHVSPETPRDPAVAAEGQGYLTPLGDPDQPHPLLAQVYTFPTTTSLQDGMVEISVEARVTADNCGREITAQSLQFGPNAQPSAVDLVMTMPDCDGVGDYLVLKNMFADLALASN